MIEFSCKNCGSKLSVKDKHSGRQVSCPKCRGINVVPDNRDKINFHCGHCGQSISVPQTHAGKKGKCPKCKKVIVVPSLEREPAAVADAVSIVCSMCNKVVQVRQTSIGQIIECTECGSSIEISSGEAQGQSDSSTDEYLDEEGPEEYDESEGVDKRITVGISAVAAVAVVGLIILAAVLRPSGSRPAKRPERLQAQPQVADTDSGPAPVTYDQKKVDEWIRQLEDKGKGGDVRRKAAELLGRTGDPRVVPALLKALADSNTSVGRSAGRALSQIGQPAVQGLAEALEDQNRLVRRSAATSLGQIGQPAVQALIKALRNLDIQVRQSAARSLGKIGDPQAVQPLIGALKDKQDSVRQAAARALGKIDDPQAKWAFRKIALGRTAAKVGSFVIELLLVCLLIFLLALGWWVLKHRPPIAEININLMLVYLGVVGVVSCATVLIEHVTSSREGLKPFFARIVVWPACLLRLMVGSRFGAWPVVLFGCLVYYGIIFRPLLRASYLNESRDGARYSALRRLFVVHCLIPVVLFFILAIYLVVGFILSVREAPLH